MAVQIQLRRDTAANWTAADPTLAEGEAGYETDTGKLKLGDGATAWSSLAYFGGGLADMGAFTYLDGTVGAAPSTPGAGKLRVYAKTGPVLAVKDDAGTETVLGQGIADMGAFTYLDATDGAAPADPTAGHARIYAKAGRIYSRDSSGTEYGPFDAAGGAAGPLLYIDSVALATGGDDFADMSAWTAGGTASAAAVTTEPYDATCQDISLPAQGDRYYKALPASWSSVSLTLHGVDHAGVPNNGVGNMLALCLVDNSGNGTGVSLYSDGQGYPWGVTGNVYSASGSSIVAWSATTGPVPPSASNWPVVYRLAKSGTTITAGISFNGGLTFKTATRTDATAFTRVMIARLFNNTAGTSKIRVGRLNFA